MSAFKTSLHPGWSLQEGRLPAILATTKPANWTASSVTLRPLLVLGPNGLAVLQGHFFIVTPVDDVIIGVVQHGERWVVFQLGLVQGVLRWRVHKGQRVQVKVQQAIERQELG